MTNIGAPIPGLAMLEVSGVAFVRNYVEFHFDGPVLRAYARSHGDCQGQ